MKDDALIQGKWLLIGHRGVGKSSFLREFSARFEVSFDLDEEIEKRSGKKITEIFEKVGEPGFRQTEAATFNKILQENSAAKSILIALGAGFKGHIWPVDYKCLWLRKESDIWPRYFNDRPQMGTSSPDSFLSAFIEREERYQAWADLALTVSEGYGAVKGAPQQWPLDVWLGDSACLTLVPRLHKDAVQSVILREKWGLRFELRTDYWPVDQIQKVLQKTKAHFLISVRNKNFEIEKLLRERKEHQSLLFDWDVILGAPAFVPDILSLHDFGAGLKQGLDKLEKYSKKYPEVLLKASPILETLFDFELLWKWRAKDPERRMIFPRSKVTRETSLWQWTRLLLKGKQKINFVREASEGLRDQPTVEEYRRHLPNANFAAILGNPVLHSYSPFFHAEFFQNKKMNFLAIPLEQIGKASFLFLQTLGAVAYAVTSPFKSHQALLELSEAGESVAHDVLNTLVFNGENWMRYNTDHLALKELPIKSHAWKVWGSGAVAKQFFKLVDNVELYSARTGELLEKKGTVPESFILLWCAGDEAPLPQLGKPNKVIDLSYGERSAANLYACQENLDYENGIEFFKIQARAQQELWKNL